MYFSWGNRDGHAEGSGYDFSQAVYDATPGAAITANLSLSQDAARANLYAPYRMPTADEFQELVDNCTYIRTTLNGVDGLLFTSNVNGNTLFFPASGFYDGANLSSLGTRGRYWSSTYSSEEGAIGLNFNLTEVFPNWTSLRHDGFTVRAVVDSTNFSRSVRDIDNLDNRLNNQQLNNKSDFKNDVPVKPID